VAPLSSPERLFTLLPGVEDWRAEDSSGYVLSVSNPRAVAPDLTRALVADGADVLSISEMRYSLKDVYLELIDEDVEARRS
jgi:ABC-2 type transport system ATP-binding protein